jgi:hypothetical protein
MNSVSVPCDGRIMNSTPPSGSTSRTTLLAPYIGCGLGELHCHSVGRIIQVPDTHGVLMAKSTRALLAAEHKIEGFAEDLGKILGSCSNES